MFFYYMGGIRKVLFNENIQMLGKTNKYKMESKFIIVPKYASALLNNHIPVSKILDYFIFSSFFDTLQNFIKKCFKFS